jgi:hypothetical protein
MLLVAHVELYLHQIQRNHLTNANKTYFINYHQEVMELKDIKFVFFVDPSGKFKKKIIINAGKLNLNNQAYVQEIDF